MSFIYFLLSRKEAQDKVSDEEIRVFSKFNESLVTESGDLVYIKIPVDKIKQLIKK